MGSSTGRLSQREQRVSERGSAQVPSPVGPSTTTSLVPQLKNEKKNEELPCDRVRESLDEEFGWWIRG